MLDFPPIQKVSFAGMLNLKGWVGGGGGKRLLLRALLRGYYQSDHILCQLFMQGGMAERALYLKAN